jgi:hypothetical protein
VCVCVFVCVYIYYTCVCIYIYRYMCVCVCVCVYTCISIYAFSLDRCFSLLLPFARVVAMACCEVLLVCGHIHTDTGHMYSIC